MKTEFITLALSLAEVEGNWPETIENRLHVHGKPLRWAVTRIDQTSQTVTIEAVITQDA